MSVSPNAENVRTRILDSVILQGRVRASEQPHYLEVAEGDLTEVSDALRALHCGWVRVLHSGNLEGRVIVAIRPLTVYFL